MSARAEYFSYKDVRRVLFDFDCNKINRLKQTQPQKYMNLNSIHPSLAKDRFWSPLRADDLLIMNQLLRILSEKPLIEGKHVTKLPLEIVAYIVKMCLQSTPLMSELWRIYIGSPGLRESGKKLQTQNSSNCNPEKLKIPAICGDNKSLNEASKMLLNIYGEKPLKRDIHLSYFKQLLHYIFKDYFNRLNYKEKRKVLDKFFQVTPLPELDQILEITQDPRKKLQKLSEITSEIQKNVSVFEYLSFRRKFVIYYFFLLKIYATTDLVIFFLLVLAFFAVFLASFTLIFFRYTLPGLFVIGFGLPLTSICCLFLIDKFSEPQLPHAATKPLEESINAFVKEQLTKTVDRQLPSLCEKWERVVLDLMPYVSHIKKNVSESFLY